MNGHRYSVASKKIHYVKVGGSYQLVKDYRYQTKIFPDEDIFYERIHLLKSGLLIVFSGYCWDGTSGPVIDRKTNMRSGCTHDALYHLMRMELLSHIYWRNADREFGRILLEDGAWKFTMKIDMAGLRLARGSAAHPKNRRKVYKAP